MKNQQTSLFFAPGGSSSWRLGPAALWAFGLGLWCAVWNASAQDRFDAAPPQQQQQQQSPQAQRPQASQQPQLQPRQQTDDLRFATPPARRQPPGGNAPAMAGSLGEAHDFGIAPTARLQPSTQLHSPTPTSIPGGKVVGTRQLAQWMQGQQGQQGKVLLLHAIGSPQHLPHAIPVTPASQGGSFDDQVQREFDQYLEQATGGDRSRLIVTYCAGVECWGSYNAALRAIRMGYTNVHWYRGGVEAWGQAGLPVLTGN